MSEPASPRLRFSIGNIPVVVGPGFFVVSALLASWRPGVPLIVEWVAVSFASVLVHELGHAAAFVAFGQSPRIELHQMGGTTYGNARLSPSKAIAVYAAGPATGFVLGGLLALVARHVPEIGTRQLAASAVRDLIWLNLGWGALNLLPILPLDGGGVARGLLQHWQGEVIGARSALQLSVVTGAIASFVAIQHGLGYPAMLGGFLALHSARQLLAEANRMDLKSGWNAIDEQRLDVAARISARLRRAWDPGIAASARRLAGVVHLLRQEGRLAREVLGDREDGLGAADAAVASLMTGDPDAGTQLAAVVARADAGAELAYLIRHLARMERFDILEAFLPYIHVLSHPALHPLESLLYAAGRTDEALRVSSETWRRFSCPNGAYNAACALVRLGRSDEALASLTNAVIGGFSDLGLLDADPDLTQLRVLPEFGELRSRVAEAKPFVSRAAYERC